MRKELKSDVVDAIMGPAIAFKKANNRNAKCVFLTPEIERRIESLTFNDIGSLAGEIMTKGARDALPKIFGLEIKSWDEENIRVE